MVVMHLCCVLWTILYMFVFVHECAGRTKALFNWTEILAGGERELSGCRAALLSCAHPAVRIMFGTLARAPSHSRPAEGWGGEEILTHFNRAGTGRKNQLTEKILS